MLAWSTEMNTIMKGTLTKVLGYQGQKIKQSEKNIWLFGILHMSFLPKNQQN